jgi:hypothetical protein
MYWIGLAPEGGQCRVLVNTVKNLRVPYSAEKSLNSYTTGGFSRGAHFHEVTSVNHVRTWNWRIQHTRNRMASAMQGKQWQL